VMFHNRTPYRVEVAVKGDRITTSIEGQTVDSWMDDTLVKGGVGFFAEAGERARIYWMKLSRNEDFLGRVCAYLAGSTEEQSNFIAGLWPAGTPDPKDPSDPGSRPRGSAIILVRMFDPHGSNHGRRFPLWDL
jgi:hypothetical protein